MKNVKVIAFDADDTLWENQTYFDETEYKFRELIQEYMPFEDISPALLNVEIGNMPIYGFGVKAFTLSMIETALKISKNKVDQHVIEKIIGLGKDILNKPIELLDGVTDVLDALHGKYKLVVATKGDLLDQERKLKKSGLEKYFHHIEVMSDKQVPNYQKFIDHLDCSPDEFLMVGNSLKSDIIPVLEIGGYAAYIPFHRTWAHEKMEDKVNTPNLIRIEKITEILPYLK
ncbi:HAD family hydrolase [Dysgonomonas sp. 520]|uniref:HAD family hydrolase n=1 Tax=Dysgonomonas sp. 520 TaxID=2302931 RepID=UPI0013CF61E9|nr:HAD family hydrolase [Dysgonomonas sp. 520]NDW09085.1 HAD family hydrolase [Dysgonomonas sp. 520]